MVDVWGGSMKIGTLVTDTDIDKDIGLVVGHHTDIDGTIYNKVYWLTGNRSVSHCCWIETECLEVICK